MSLLRWPRDTTPLDSKRPLPDKDFQTLCDPIPSVYEDDVGRPELDITLTELIDERPDGNSQVFRARWRVHPTAESPNTVEQDVVCKVGYGKRRVLALNKERQLYEKCTDIQGAYVPIMYGCFVGETPEEGPMAVLILEDCGSALSASLKCYSIEVRKAAVISLLGVHLMGVQHGDFAERNLVVKMGDDGKIKVRLVDFESGSDHTCAFRHRLQIYGTTLPRDSFPCRELYDACVAAEVWRPGEYLFLGSAIPAEWAAGTVEELVEKVQASGLPAARYSAEKMRREAEEVIYQLQSWERDRYRWDKAPLSIN